MVTCPMFHFVPIRQYVIGKHLMKVHPKVKRKFPSRKEIKLLKRRDVFYPLTAHKGEFRRIEKMNKQAQKRTRKRSSKAIFDFINQVAKASPEDASQGGFSLNTIYHQITKEIKDEISKVPLFLKEQKMFEWNLEADAAYDFEFYFPEENPSSINQRLHRLKHKC